MLENWAIGKKELENIIVLAKDIIDAKTTFLLAKTSTRTALFDNELTVFQNAQVSDAPTDMDKWLALVVGNLLHDDVPEDRDFFNGRLEFPEHLFEMIKGWNYYKKNSAPSWTTDYFYGIKVENVHLDRLILDGLNLRYMTTDDCFIKFGSLRNVNLSELKCKILILGGFYIEGSKFDNMNIEGQLLLFDWLYSR